jgi:hypothetical protein
VTQCYSSSDTFGEGYESAAGGLVGRNWGSVSQCYSTGAVGYSDQRWRGGLVGGDYSGTVAASFWDTQTSGYTWSAGGAGKTTAQMHMAKTFLDAGWDFVGETPNGTEEIWQILEGKDYPRLAWKLAFSPDPPNGAIDVIQSPVLSWHGAAWAVEHDVYFGGDKDAVVNATRERQGVYRGRQVAATTTYNPTTLEWGKTYHWRIDEVNEADPNSPWKGTVWSFTTIDFIALTTVDDFESYTDNQQAGVAIYQTWIDGLGPGANVPGNSTGSWVGNHTEPFAEQKIVHSGRQSMPMDYNNVNKPWYSEAQRIWTTPQNWTGNGADTLTLYFRGEPNNSPEPLYVGIEDSVGRNAVVVHPEAEAVRATGWQKWHIALGEVRAAGVNLAAVKKMVIGVGDRKDLRPSGTGRIYIDDIRLTKRMP